MTKDIWLYWSQGWDHAPRLVTTCRDTWIRQNPGYRVHALDRHSARDCVTPSGVDLTRPDITVQKEAALLRLALLAERGGVWVDPTVACISPLDSWLSITPEAPFFAFRKPGPDRLASNWLIGADPHSVIVQTMRRDFTEYFANNRFSRQSSREGEWLLRKFERLWSRDVKSSVAWHSWFARRVLRVYPYFIFHYTFNRVILNDAACAEEWERGQRLPADLAHRMQYWAAQSRGATHAIAEIDAAVSPVQKLDWRVDADSEFWSAVLSRLDAVA